MDVDAQATLAQLLESRGADANIFGISQLDVLGHGGDSLRTINLQWLQASNHPRGKNDIGVTQRVVGMEVGDEKPGQIGRPECRNPVLLGGRLRLAYNPWARVKHVGLPIHNDCNGWPGRTRVWDRSTGAENNHLGLFRWLGAETERRNSGEKTSDATRIGNLPDSLTADGVN